MKYKVGDRVRIKSIDWYNENKNKIGFICFNYANFIPEMSRYCGEILTINRVVEEFEQYLVSECAFSWADEMIEGLVEEETKVGTALNPIELKSNANCLTQERVDEMLLDKAEQITDFEYEGLAYTLPDGYQFVDENGNVITATKIVLEKKKKEYPKTYEECCKILGLLNVDLCFNTDYRSFYASKEQWKRLGLMNQFYQLLICRDAYWKIAGEEMGLGKPWEPDWENSEERRYSIVNIEGDINLPEKTLTKWILKVTNKILVFPTEEMRDAFKENFDPDIEICKELL